MELLSGWDLSIFYWVNHGWARPWLDPVFIFLTERKNLVAPVAVLLVFLLFRQGLKGRLVVLALLISILLTDQVSSHVIKPMVHRVRPCVTLRDARTPDGKDYSLSFPSGHATNIAGAMLVLSLGYPARTWLWACLGLLVGLSRIYVGVHYPSDVLGGFVLGLFLGWIAWNISGKVGKQFDKRRERLENHG